MITGASNADCVVLLVDVTKAIDGELLEQTKRHALVSSILNIPNVILAVNKMDLVSFDESIFQKVNESFKKFTEILNWKPNYKAIPISALKGDNIVAKSKQMRWYKKGTLIQILEDMAPSYSKPSPEIKFPIQYVMRWDGEKQKAQRAYCGKIEEGTLELGQKLKISGTDQIVTVKKIVYAGCEVSLAKKSNCIMIWLTDEVDLSRGNVLLNKDSRLEVSSNLFVALTAKV